jgi:hypothetical protein
MKKITYTLFAGFVLVFSGVSVQSSSDNVQASSAPMTRTRAIHMIDATNTALARTKNYEVRGDLLVDLKLGLKLPMARTQQMSGVAIKLYKMKERALSRNLNPFDTILDCFHERTDQSYQKHMAAEVTYLEGHERLLRMREISRLYNKIGIVHQIDGTDSLADFYFLLAARLLIDGLYDESDAPYIASTLRQAKNLLQKTSIYKGRYKPLFNWGLDHFRFNDRKFGDKLCEFVFSTEVEFPNATDKKNFIILHNEQVEIK